MSFMEGVNKTSNVQFLAFSTYKLDIQLSSGVRTMLVWAHSLIQCDLLSLNPILFISNFPVHFFFHTTTTNSLTSKPIFWCTTLITLSIQIHAKGRLNKLLPLLLIFWLLSPHAYARLRVSRKGNLKDCYAGHLFFFIFSYPLQFFRGM